MTAEQVVEADLTWTGQAVETGIQVVIGSDGRIARVGSLGLEPSRRLSGRALLPGFVNAHSHAFQRGLRGGGRGERFPMGTGTFWTWRDAMYGLVDRLEESSFLAATIRAFREMRTAGITTVGEFHYLHHREPLDFAFDRLVLQAAREAGIRLVLLTTFFKTGRIGQPLRNAQRRFATPSVEGYWAELDALSSEANPRFATVGAVVHSVRAATPDDLAAIHAEALRRGLPFHIHVEEQRREVEHCLEAYGSTPMRLLLDRVESARNITAIHCTQTFPNDRNAFLEQGGRICVCPLTEANLGDGLPTLEDVPSDRLCLGTDSNARIDMVEEARWLEYGQRLRRQERGALRDQEGQVARVLLRAATAGGAASLGVPAGRIEPDAWADFLVLDLGHPSLAEVEPEALVDAWLFGGGSDAIVGTCVGGDWSKGPQDKGLSTQD